MRHLNFPLLGFSFVWLALSFGMPCSTHANDSAEPIRHVVCFKFKKEAKTEEIQKVEKAFSALKDKIDGILSLEWGKNNSPEGLNKEFTHCFIVTFENAKAREVYLPHPAHKAFVAILKPILDDVFVIDFTP
ncbi:MAG: Dabb family protein [Verrucomicrobiota bacterium]|nr:Dabb family protein [Verrucomicrobiota bacterium]